MQTLTSGLNNLKNNQNKSTNSENENYTQKQIQTTPSPPLMPSLCKYRILQRNDNTSSQPQKNSVNTSHCTKNEVFH